MQSAHRILSAIALAALSASSMAATTTYTSSASFMTAIGLATSYTQNFNGLPNPPAGPVPFGDNGLAYTLAAPSDIYASGDFFGTSLPNEALTVSFTSGNVYAVGGNFYATDIGDNFNAVSVTLTLNDGTVATFTPTSVGDSYRGFTSNVAFSSLVMSAPVAALNAGLDNLTVAVPEPSGWLMMGLGLAGLLAARRRKA